MTLDNTAEHSTDSEQCAIKSYEGAEGEFTKEGTCYKSVTRVLQEC
jgi:hypothetical protein